jgi:hypothetical protein
MPCLALVETTEQYEAARAVGVDQVLSSGVSIGQIFAAILQLLPRST